MPFEMGAKVEPDCPKTVPARTRRRSPDVNELWRAKPRSSYFYAPLVDTAIALSYRKRRTTKENGDLRFDAARTRNPVELGSVRVRSPPSALLFQWATGTLMPCGSAKSRKR